MSEFLIRLINFNYLNETKRGNPKDSKEANYRIFILL